MEKSFLESEIERIVCSEDLHYDWWFFDDAIVEFKVEYGDWKHDHIFLDLIMKENGWKKVDEVILDEDGSDCYSSIHKYEFCRC